MLQYKIIFFITLLSIASAVVLDEFNFLRQQCKYNNIDNISPYKLTGYLSGISSILSCPLTNGVQPTVKLRSELTVQQLKSKLGSGGFTFELWIQPILNLTMPSPLISIGKDGASSNACENNLVISQSATTFNGQYSTGSMVMDVCNGGTNSGMSSWNILISPQTTLLVDRGVPRLLHVVIRVTFSRLRVGSTSLQFIETSYTINGVTHPESSAALAGAFDATGWDPSGYLNLFPATDTSRARSAVPGNIYYFAIHNTTVTAEQAAERYRTRLPNSLPVPVNLTCTIQENGEVGDHSFQPQFYTQPIPNHELAVLHLKASDLEDFAYGPPQPGERTVVFLTSFPVNAQLYYLNGSLLPAGQQRTYIPYNDASQSYPVRIRPPLNQYSAKSTQPLVSFSFAAIDGVTGLRSVEDAWVKVVVTHVDKPPIATPTALVMFSRVATRLELTGTDPDSAIANAYITTPPASALLYSCNSNGTRGGRLLSPYRIAGPPFRLYCLDIATRSAPTGAQNLVGTDYLEFALQDVEGRLSAPAGYVLSLVTPVQATPISAEVAGKTLASEDSLSTLQLFGRTVATTPLPLYATIVTPPQLGSLFAMADSTGSRPLLQGTALLDSIPAGNLTVGVPVWYRAPSNYFTTPSVTWDGTPLQLSADSFTYKIICPTDGTESVAVTQSVSIKNVNDMTQIAFIYPSATTALQVGSSGSITLSGFNITDPDRGVDVVRVSMASKNGGIFALNPKTVGALDFNSKHYCKTTTNSWHCTGDGTTMVKTFVTTPAAAQAALNGMTFLLSDSAQEDEVTVTIYDGEGGECLTNTQHGDGSIRSGCYQSEVTVQFQQSSGKGSELNSGSNSEVMSTLMYVGGGLTLCFMLTAMRCFLLRRAKRRAEKDDEKVSRKDGREDGTRPGVFTRAAESLYHSLPLSSPVGTPQRQRKKRYQRSKRAEGGENTSSEEDEGVHREYDLEECRTPPRKATLPTPPCTPASPDPLLKTPREDGTLRKTFASPRAIKSPQRTQDTQTAVEIFSIYVHEAPRSQRSPKRKTKGFPQLEELGRKQQNAVGPATASRRSQSASPTKRLTATKSCREEGWLEHSDLQSVSTMTCSVSTRNTPQQHLHTPPPRHKGYNVPSPASEASPMCPNRSAYKSPSRPKQLMDRREGGIASPDQNSSVASSARRPGQRGDSPNKALRGRDSFLEKLPSRRDSGSSRDVGAAAAAVVGGTEGGWSQHTHRNGKVFYHNTETGKSTWKRPTELAYTNTPTALW